MDRSKLDAVVSDLEAAAYQRGLDDALEAIVNAVDKLRVALPRSVDTKVERPPKQPARRQRQGSAQSSVLLTIQQTPGLRGFEILKSIVDAGKALDERTMRTALGRLRRRGQIHIEDQRWYPVQPNRSKSSSLAEMFA